MIAIIVASLTTITFAIEKDLAITEAMPVRFTAAGDITRALQIEVNNSA